MRLPGDGEYGRLNEEAERHDSSDTHGQAPLPALSDWEVEVGAQAWGILSTRVHNHDDDIAALSEEAEKRESGDNHGRSLP